MKDHKSNDKILRQKAEMALKETSNLKLKKEQVKLSDAEVFELQQELEVHKIQLELAKRQNEDLNYSLFHANHSVMLLIDPKTGEIKDANLAASNFYGWSKDELCHKNIADINTLSKAEVKLELKKATKEERTHFNFKHKLANLEIRDVEVYSSTVQFGNTTLLYSIVHDITERKITEEKLIESEKKYRNIYESVIDVYYEATLEGIILEVSPSVEILLEGERTREGLIGSSLLGFYSSASDRDSFIKELTKKGSVTDYEFTFKIANGSEIYIAVSSTLKYDKNGNPEKITGILRNITERKKAEIILKQSNKKWEAIIASSPYGIGIISLDGKLLLASNKLASMYGYATNELDLFIGTSTFDFIDPSNHKSLIENTKKLLNNNLSEKNSEYLSLKKDKSKFYSEVSSTILLDEKGNPESILYIQQDITERKKAEQLLIDSSQKLNLLINNLSGVIYSSKFDGEIWKLEYISKGVFELTGYTENEFLNNPKVKFKNLIHKDDQDRERSVIDKHLLSKLPFEIEYRVLNLNGEEKWVLERGRGIYEDDKLVALEGFILDITDKKKFETDLILKDVRYVELLEHSQTVIWEVDINGLYTYVSPTAESVYGHKDFELVGKKYFYDIAPKELREDVKKYGVESIRRGDELVNYDNAIEKKDGTVIWVTTNGRPYFDKYNNIKGYRGSDVDITERKLAEDELRKNEEELNQAQEIAKMGSWYLNLITDETTLSKNYYKLVEREEKDIIKKSDLLFPLIYEDDIESLNNVVEKIKENKASGTSSVRLVMPNGKPKWFESTIVPVYENDILIALKGVKVDISEKKLQENEIRKLSTAIAQSPSSMVITDLEGKISYVSPAFTDITGYSAKEALGKKASMLKSGKTSDAVYKDLWNTITSGKIWKAELMNRRKNGELYWESVSITPILNENNEISNYLAIKEDISKYKNALQEINELNSNLELKVEVRTQELIESNFLLLQEVENRNRISEALIESEYNYRNVVENLNEIVFQTDANGLWIFLNESWEKITGFSVEESLGELFVNYVHPEDRQRNMDLFAPLINREKDYCRHEVRYLTKAGGFRWIEVYARLGVDNENEITGTYGTLQDITNRKETEAALEIEKQRLASIIEGTNVGTWEWNVKTGETMFNERWANILGYSLEEISPISIETWIKFSHPEDLHKSNELLKMHFQGTTDYYSFESRMKHRNGSWVWVLDRGKVNKWDNDGKPLLMSGTHQDITEQKEAEEELNWNKTLLELMSNSSPLGFLVVDNRTDDILYFNQRFCQIWEIEELANQMGRGELKNNDIIPYCLPVLADIPAFAESCKPLQSEHNRIVLEDEIAFTFNRTIHRYSTQIRGIKDEYFGRFYIFEDITERKIADKEVLNAKNEAEKANKAKSEFLSRMSHELRTPLTSILGFSQLMKMSNLSEAHKTNVDYIYSSGKHLLNLINEVLDISKIEAGKISLSIEPIQVSALLNEVIDTLQPQVKKMNINLKMLDSSYNELYVNADLKRLKQILLNLLDNAIKYNKTGGFVKVFTEIMPKNSIGIASLRISIIDTGVGISIDGISKIFTPFERIGAERTEIEGTGLGLSVVKKLIDAMGGKIGVESVLDEGSTFWFELPLAENIKTVINLTSKEAELTAALAIANKKLYFQNEEKEKRADELEIANIELAFQNEEKGKRADELEIANLELDFQNEEKGKRANELEIANIELDFQNGEKEKRADELEIANKEISSLKGHISKTAKYLSKRPSTILYVEDNIFNIKLVKNILSEQYAPINFITDSTGSEAVKLAIENQPDLILLDLDLPFMKGSEILELLLKEEKTKKIPVIIITASIFPKQREKLLKEGAKEYINKPIDIPAFLKILEEYLIKK